MGEVETAWKFDEEPLTTPVPQGPSSPESAKKKKRKRVEGRTQRTKKRKLAKFHLGWQSEDSTTATCSKQPLGHIETDSVSTRVPTAAYSSKAQSSRIKAETGWASAHKSHRKPSGPFACAYAASQLWPMHFAASSARLTSDPDLETVSSDENFEGKLQDSHCSDGQESGVYHNTEYELVSPPANIHQLASPLPTGGIRDCSRGSSVAPFASPAWSFRSSSDASGSSCLGGGGGSTEYCGFSIET